MSEILTARKGEKAIPSSCDVWTRPMGKNKPLSPYPPFCKHYLDLAKSQAKGTRLSSMSWPSCSIFRSAPLDPFGLELSTLPCSCLIEVP